jgi:death-on-curing protein
MISVLEAERIHDVLIEQFGGVKGIRDKGLLESALLRPYQTFDGKELYPTPVDKAAALFESLVTNHPFLDGNKRIAYVLMRITLRQSNVVIEGSGEMKYDFVIQVASGQLNFENIRSWIAANTRPH